MVCVVVGGVPIRLRHLWKHHFVLDRMMGFVKRAYLELVEGSLAYMNITEANQEKE